jgi:hypothetical protein
MRALRTSMWGLIQSLIQSYIRRYLCQRVSQARIPNIRQYRKRLPRGGLAYQHWCDCIYCPNWLVKIVSRLNVALAGPEALELVHPHLGHEGGAGLLPALPQVGLQHAVQVAAVPGAVGFTTFGWYFVSLLICLFTQCLVRVYALHCTALHCTALHCTALHCTHSVL